MHIQRDGKWTAVPEVDCIYNYLLIHSSGKKLRDLTVTVLVKEQNYKYCPS